MAKFGCIWGVKWHDHVASCGGLDAVSAEWRAGIDGMSGEKIKRALTHCRLNCQWPPSIAEFRDAATGGATAEQRAFYARIQPDGDELKALSATTWAERREQVAEQLRALRESLHSPKSPPAGADATNRGSP